MNTRHAQALRIARQSLLAYALYVHPGYQIAKCHRILAWHLEQASLGKIKRLMVTFPRRMGKSTLTSQLYPVWQFGQTPQAQVIQTGYGASIALEHSKKGRRFFLDPKTAHVFPEISHSTARQKYHKDHIAAHEWETPQGGRYYATGINGAVTGRGADWLLIDDPHKNRKEAESFADRDGVYQFYRSTLYPLLSPDAVIVLTASRWHVDDLPGRLLREMDHGGEKWVHLHMPAINKAGESIWPERWPVERLRQIEQVVQPIEWNAQYQGTPLQPGGNTFKREWWEAVGTRWAPEDKGYHNRCVERILSFDTAEEETETAAFSACCELELLPDYKAILTNVTAEKLEFTRLVDWTLRLCEKANYDGKLKRVIIEKKSSGTALISYLQVNGPEWLRPLILANKPKDSKEYRGQLASRWCSIGAVLLPHPADSVPWLYHFEEDLFSFPSCEYKDKIDAFTQAIWYWEHMLATGSRTGGIPS